MARTIIEYGSWNDMLNARDELHTIYIREYNKPNTRYEVVHYSKWNEDTYVAHCGYHAETLDEVIEDLERRGYDTSKIDICTYHKEA